MAPICAISDSMVPVRPSTLKYHPYCREPRRPISVGESGKNTPLFHQEHIKEVVDIKVGISKPFKSATFSPPLSQILPRAYPEVESPSVYPALSEVQSPPVYPAISEVQLPRVYPSISEVDFPRVYPAISEVQSPRVYPAISEIHLPRVNQAISETPTLSSPYKTPAPYPKCFTYPVYCTSRRNRVSKSGRQKLYAEEPVPCGHCKRKIESKYLLQALDKHWHEKCLKCDFCRKPLYKFGCRFYFRQGAKFCQDDFLRTFGGRGTCSKCDQSIPPTDYVLRFKGSLNYHLDCFKCTTCRTRFCVGDMVKITDPKHMFCNSCEQLSTKDSIS